MKGFLKNGGLFLLLLAMTAYVIGRELEPGQIRAASESTDRRYLLLGLGAMAVFVINEGYNIVRMLRSFGCKVTPWQGIRYAMTGFFFSAVTPSASGGQPMQLYAMHRDGVDLSKGTLALLGELLSFQLVSTALAAAGFLYHRHVIVEAAGSGWYLFLAGMGLNLIVAAVLLLVLLRPGAACSLIRLAVRILSLFSRTRAERAESFLNVQLADYLNSAKTFRRNPLLIAKTLGTTLVQLTAMYSVTYLVYRAMGFEDWGFLQVTALQAVLSVSVSALPLPGAVGVSEGGFLLLFRAFFPGQAIGSAMILSRTVSFYLPVAVTGIFTAIRTAAGKNIDKQDQKVYP